MSFAGIARSTILRAILRQLTGTSEAQFDRGLQASIAEVLDNLIGDLELTQFATGISVANNTTATVATIQPPADISEEWIPFLVQMIDTANIDPLDGCTMRYSDAITGLNVTLHRDQTSSGAGSSGETERWTWPSMGRFGVGGNPTQWLDYRLYRKNMKEPWRQLIVNVITTGTVGTRLLGVNAVYQRRPI
jgi:hypothetical protein